MIKDYVYPIVDYRAVDGDTIEVVLDCGFNATLRMYCRLHGVDTPERKHGEAYVLCKQVTERWLEEITKRDIRVQSIAKDKYAGRFIGEVFDARYRVVSLNTFLLEKRLGQPYDGGTRLAWDTGSLNDVCEIAGALLGRHRMLDVE